MPKRPPGKGKGKGADIYLGKEDAAPPQKRRAPKGRGAEVFLGSEPAPPPAPQPKRPPLLAPTALAAALDQAALRLHSSHGSLDHSHLIVMLWLQIALKEAAL
jgi:hypothetical protein